MKMMFWLMVAGLSLQAPADSRPLETAALQAQIDAAAANGGGRVVVAPGVHRTGLLRLRSNVTLEVPADAELSGSTDLADYGVDPKDRKAIFALVVAENATNVAIVGKGVVNGNGSLFPAGDDRPDLPRPRLAYFHRCEGVVVESVTLRDPAMWTCYFRLCRDVTARGVKIRAQANHNNDGFDIEAKGVLIEDCDIDSLDDAVCFKSDDPDFVVGDAEVRNCTLASCSSAVKFGTSSFGAFRNVSIHDCTLRPCAASPILDWTRPGNWWGLGIVGVTNRISGVSGLSLEAVDGGSFENVAIRNLAIHGYHTAVFMRHASRSPAPAGRESVFRNVLVENVVGDTVSSIANSITGAPGRRPNGITLRNVDITCRGGANVADAKQKIPECEWGYPENRMFYGKALPAWGFYVRHADGVVFDNVRLRLAAPDVRPTFVAEDCASLVTNSLFCGDSPAPAGAQFVDPLIGCAWNGHTFPGPSMPFGFVQPGPDTGNGDWAHCSGYVHADDRVYGFSQTHLSGTGCPDFGDVRLLPFMGIVADDADDEALYSLKDLYGLKVGECETGAVDDYNECEKAEVGLYRVALTNLNTCTYVTAGMRTAFYRFQARGHGKLHLLVDPQWGQLWLGRRMEEHILAYADKVDADNMGISGGFVHRGWLDREVHFKLRFSRPFSRLRKLPSLGGEKASRYLLDFDVGRLREVEATISLSTTDGEGAERNFAAESPMGFDGARAACVAAWNGYLGRVSVDGVDLATRTTLYTSLYHAFLQPNVISDVDGRYRGPDKQIHVAPAGRGHYSGFSLWDTFRAAHPLYTIMTPELVDDFVASMLENYRHHGFLPVIEFGGAESYCMIGNHAVPVVVDAVMKGFRGFDRRLAYEAVTNSLTVAHQTRDHGWKIKEDWNILDRFGYYPYDLIEGESVSRTLECAYDDACAARFAALVGDGEGLEFFKRRSCNWTNVLDHSIGLVRGKDVFGRWRDPFDPFRFGGGGEWAQYDCTEGNAWQYTWSVMHDPAALISSLGGKEAFVGRLDSVFGQSEMLRGAATAADTTGLIGQYVHGNEPSHHMAFFYALAGRPDRTADVVREVCDRFYLPKVDGLCGNDDCGQMSAWYVFACLGFYPFDPCGGDYVIGAPQVPEVTVRLRNGRVLKVEARDFSRKNRHVGSVELNGKPVAGPLLRHSDIMQGGTLVFQMKRPSGL